ncbi:hypothetical protein J5751_01165 [bacterium]|nr:hypothetical protein [bacterium]
MEKETSKIVDFYFTNSLDELNTVKNILESNNIPNQIIRNNNNHPYFGFNLAIGIEKNLYNYLVRIPEKYVEIAEHLIPEEKPIYERTNEKTTIKENKSINTGKGARKTEKIIRRKGSVVFCGIILLALIAFAIFNKEFFFIEITDFDITNGSLEFKKVKELEPRLVLIYLAALIFFLIIFIHSLLWKLEYDEVSFSVKNEDIYNLEYKKIVSIVHYKAYRYRSSINKFIISYMGMPEFGYKEELQKSFIKYFTHNSEMKEFFSFVYEKNPNIDFHSEKAGSDGVEITEFDYFSD